VRRRDFIRLIGAAVALPAGVRTERQKGELHRIGYHYSRPGLRAPPSPCSQMRAVLPAPQRKSNPLGICHLRCKRTWRLTDACTPSDRPCGHQGQLRAHSCVAGKRDADARPRRPDCSHGGRLRLASRCVCGSRQARCFIPSDPYLRCTDVASLESLDTRRQLRGPIVHKLRLGAGTGG